MPSNLDAVILDCEFIATRRLELGLSQRAVARSIGVSPSVVRRIELGLNHPDLLLGTTHKLALTLETSLDRLLATRSDQDVQTATSDDRKIEAALLGSRRKLSLRELCESLEFSRARTLEALHMLERRLRSTGAALSRTNTGYRIVARDNVLSATETQRLGAAKRKRSELTAQEARMLRRIIAGEVGPSQLAKRISGSDGAAIGALRRNGMVEPTPDGGLKATPAVEFSLGLTDRFPRNRKRPA